MREFEIARNVTQSLTNREIAQQLELSPHTVKNCPFRIFDKLGVSALISAKRNAGLTDALRALSLHPWPGNVRVLQNRVQRAVIMANGECVAVRDLELTDTLSALPPQTLKEARETVEREMVTEALRRHIGKVTAAALELGVSRPTLHESMEKLGIVRESS
jgi:DNA-binding NtrC family response regulator